MPKKSFIIVLLMLTFYITYYSNSHAGVHFIVQNGGSGNLSEDKSCWQKGYRLISCPTGDCESCKDSSNGKIYYKKSVCDTTGYTVSASDCKSPKQPNDKSPCADLYKSCECSAGYKYTEEDCKKRGKVAGLLCDSKTAFCQCPSSYKSCYNGMIGSGGTCEDELTKAIYPNDASKYTKYKSCICSSTFQVCDENGPEPYASSCTEEDGTEKWDKCKVPAKTCASINAAYKDSIPDEQTCTSIVTDGVTCYKDCRDLTCEETTFYSSGSYRKYITTIYKNEKCAKREFTRKTCYYNCQGKYVIVDDMPHPSNSKLHRIRATKDFTLPNGKVVKRGDLGGYIEKESNLDNYQPYLSESIIIDTMDVSWVYDDAQVYGDAVVSQDAAVYGKAVVSGVVTLYGEAKVYGNAVVNGSELSVWGEIFEDAEVSGSGYIFGGEIYGKARVSGNVSIHDKAKIYGNAKIYDTAQIWDAEVYGDAEVYENGDVRSNAKVYGKAKIYDFGNAWNCEVYDNAQIYETASVNGGKIYGNAKIYGSTTVDSGNIFGNAQIYGHAKIISGSISGNAEVYYYTEFKDGNISSGKYACSSTVDWNTSECQK